MYSIIFLLLSGSFGGEGSTFSSLLEGVYLIRLETCHVNVSSTSEKQRL